MLDSSMKPRRSILSMPADRARFHVKAEGIPADEVMFDLEDSVAESNKELARRQLIESLNGDQLKDRIVAVRVNPVASNWFEMDLEAAARCHRIDSIVIPKVSSSDDVRRVEQGLKDFGRPLSIEAQIETATGLQHAADIAAASPQVVALHFGPLDMAASIGMPLSGSTMPDDLYSLFLFHVLIAARAAGKQAIDGPYPAIGDGAGLRRALRRAVRLGYEGKWAIHPDQVVPINRAFTPKKADQLKAQSIVDAYNDALSKGNGVFALKDEMVDEAVVRWAATTLSRANAGKHTERNT